jgi:surfeit locus 1 family protein
MDHVSPARQHDARGSPGGRGSRRLNLTLLALCLALAAAFAGLGVWQVERLAWKQRLIATVEKRLRAPPVPPPSWSDWSPDDAYTRVTVTGIFRHDRETAVLAVTESGPGWWLMTPLLTERGYVLVNRGFVPGSRRDPSTRPAGQIAGRVRVTGLLRASEPGGGFLRSNAPAAGRWYSRDVAAIARARGLREPVAPFFIDADAAPNPGGYPAGGLTVIRFRNSHLAYALTWFGLSVLSLAGAFVLFQNRPARTQ